MRRDQTIVSLGLLALAILFAYQHWRFVCESGSEAPLEKVLVYASIAFLPALAVVAFQRLRSLAEEAALREIQRVQLKVQENTIKQISEKLSYLTFYDKLTGVYNRSYAEERIEHLDTEESLPLSVLVADINGLKLINDGLGHSVGDELLRQAAKVLHECCRDGDLIARWSGDEFVVVMPNTDSQAASETCNRISTVRKDVTDARVRLSLSVGMATKEKTETDFAIILRDAEDMMYRSKLLNRQSNRSAIMASLERTLEERSHETREHAYRIREMAEQLGRAAGIPKSEMDALSLLATLHDLGKVIVPEGILKKPGPLTPNEWEFVRKHPEAGYRIAHACTDLKPIAEAILAHHERWDGKGYPRGLAGNEIPRLARIISIVDAYDVMVSGRPYRPPVDPEDALKEIERCSGTQFDPDLARLFILVTRRSLGRKRTRRKSG